MSIQALRSSVIRISRALISTIPLINHYASNISPQPHWTHATLYLLRFASLVLCLNGLFSFITKKTAEPHSQFIMYGSNFLGSLELIANQLNNFGSFRQVLAIN